MSGIKQKNKSRAIIINDQNELLIVNYNGVFLLPGGKVEDNETHLECLKRELKEELGINIIDSELEPFIKVIFTQENYLTRDGKKIDRKISTEYYIIRKNVIINQNETHLTEEEKNALSYYYIPIDDIKRLLEQPSNNPRKKFFDLELKTVINSYINKTKSDDNSLSKDNPKILQIKML